MAMTLDRPPVSPKKTGGPMPVIKHLATFDRKGYPGWWALVRTNVLGSDMDDYRSGDSDRWWKAIGEIVQEWNFCDEKGKPMPLPRDGTKPGELPEDLTSELLRQWREAFNEQSQPPKESSEHSTTTSTTSP